MLAQTPKFSCGQPVQQQVSHAVVTRALVHNNLSPIEPPADVPLRKFVSRFAPACRVAGSLGVPFPAIPSLVPGKGGTNENERPTNSGVPQKPRNGRRLGLFNPACKIAR
jgi:hypothetical protein